MKLPEYLTKLKKRRLFYIRRILGNSMLPSFRPGELMLILPLQARVGDVVIARKDGREIIKRIKSEVQQDSFLLMGDNKSASTDSRKFGPVKRADIVGRVVFKFPTAIDPTKPKNKLGKVLNFALAVLVIGLVVLQLTGLSEFIRDLDNTLPIGHGLASWMVVVILLTEIFALPYLLMARLSPLGHAVSGYFTVVAPLEWTLISVWSYGHAGSIGITGSAIHLTSSAGLLIGTLVWLILAYVVLGLRGYLRTFARFQRIG